MDLDHRLDDMAALAEPVRRALYRHVARQPDAVGRDAAASAVGIGRALAAFHLDRLVEAGLLTAEYRRLTGRTGPGAGRPAKVYRRSDRTIEVSLPERRYELVARLLAQAAEGAAPRAPIAERLDDAARSYGESLGREARHHAGPRPSPARLREAGLDVLRAEGFEPVQPPSGGPIVLRNCPFDALARDYRELVCVMNLSLVSGLVAGLRRSGLEAVFEPQPGRCCVVLASA